VRIDEGASVSSLRRVLATLRAQQYKLLMCDTWRTNQNVALRALCHHGRNHIGGFGLSAGNTEARTFLHNAKATKSFGLITSCCHSCHILDIRSRTTGRRKFSVNPRNQSLRFVQHAPSELTHRRATPHSGVFRQRRWSDRNALVLQEFRRSLSCK
jgi:hypothetical protein